MDMDDDYTGPLGGWCEEYMTRAPSRQFIAVYMSPLQHTSAKSLEKITYTFSEKSKTKHQEQIKKNIKKVNVQIFLSDLPLDNKRIHTLKTIHKNIIKSIDERYIFSHFLRNVNNKRNTNERKVTSRKYCRISQFHLFIYSDFLSK